MYSFAARSWAKLTLQVGNVSSRNLRRDGRCATLQLQGLCQDCEHTLRRVPLLNSTRASTSC